MNFEKLEEYLSHWQRYSIPAFTLIVTKDGKEIFRRSEGLESPEKNLYWACSITKISTCVAAVRAWQDGKLNPEDPVSKYLPAFGKMMVEDENGIRPAATEMTLKHLFTMTSGMDYRLDRPELEEAIRQPGADTLSIVNAMATYPLLSDPGARFRYSLSHDVLAAVVEVATGVRFADYMKEILLDPLGMKDTGFHPTAEQNARFMKQYRWLHRVSTEIPCHNPYCLGDRYDSGGAGFFTTADDQIKLMTVLSCGGKTADGYELLSPESIAKLQKNELPKLDGFFTGHLYGYGWGYCGRVHYDKILSRSPSSIGEFGWDGATGSFALCDPEKKLAIFFGMHQFNYDYAPYSLHTAMRDLIYEAIEN